MCRPLLDVLVDVEAAASCSAFVGTMDAHMSELMLHRMTERIGAVPPFYSALSPLSRFRGLKKDWARGNFVEARDSRPAHVEAPSVAMCLGEQAANRALDLHRLIDG